MIPTGAVVPNRLRVAVVASDAAMRSRLAEIIFQCGHELVEATAAPDALLTDGTADGAVQASAIVLAAGEGDSAGLLPPDASAAQIDAALRAVAAGLTVRSPARQARTFGSLPEEPPVLLTPREVEVLTAIGNGLSNKAAARRLGISPHTVKFHIESLFRKLGASSRAEAVVKGLKRQIVEF
jgi:DNA-binding CsgD family transcriptional regulator